jgi:hypothetical protein
LSLYFNTANTCVLGSLNWRLTQIRATSTFNNPETVALASNITPAPAISWLTAVDTAITNLKAAGIWQTFDLFYGFSAVGANARTYNWVDITTGRLTANGTLNYVDNGYAASDGTTGWFSSSFNVNSGKATDGNAEFGYFCLSEALTESVCPFGTSGGKSSFSMQATSTAVANLSAKLNTSSAASFSSKWGSTVGHFVLQQNTTTQLEAYLDGTSLGTSTQTHSADTGTVQIFKNSASAFTSRQTAFVHYGSKLTAPQHLTLSKVLYTFLTTVAVRPEAGGLGSSTGPTNIAPYKHIPTGTGNGITVPLSPSFPSGNFQGGSSAYPYAAILVNDPNYTSLLRLEVHPGDRAPFDSSGITRSQFNTAGGTSIPYATTCDIAYSFYIEPGSVADANSWNDIIDLHDQSSVGPNCGPTHAIATSTPNSPYKFFVWGIVNKTTFKNSNAATYITLAAGQWHHVRTTFRCDDSPNGFCQSWVNGVQVLNVTGEQWGAGSVNAPMWWNIALYRGNSNAPPFAIWYANLEFDKTGAAPYASRITSPLPVPPLT